jgi:aspartyl-tRNA(Asn)/glutamyl-tRNA(Gln) amidotransferase subunit A
MDEFAMGGSTENSAFGVTKNPYDNERVAGGSSGGSAAALSMNSCLGALGSDTGGSIRQPASFCGVVGLKPTYGAVSRYGVMAMASSLDQIGPFGKTVEDAEIIFNVIKGKDPMDATSFDGASSKIKNNISEMTIGVPKTFLQKGVDSEVLSNFDSSIESLKSLGAKVVEIDLPNIKYSLPVYYIIMPAEVSSNLARFDGVKYGLHKNGENIIDDYFKTRADGFGKEVRRRVMLGTYVLSSGYYDSYYGKALSVREMIKKDFENVFDGVDVVAMPTSPVPAFKIGERTMDPISMYLADIFTVSANLAEIPAISVPSGFVEKDGKNLPLGIQFLAPKFCEETLFTLGKSFENIFPKN